MLEAPLRTASVLASIVVIASFGMFAIDETRDASQHSRDAIAGLVASRTADPTQRQERARERVHGTTRELIDDANDVLVAPFASVVPADAGAWASRALPGLCALLVWGLGLGFLARFARGRA